MDRSKGLFVNKLIKITLSFLIIGYAFETNANNPNHEAIMAMPSAEQIAFFTKYLKQNKEACEPTKVFFQGLDGSETAYWNIGCTNGNDLVISIGSDGKSKALECSVLKTMSRVECFKKLEDQ